MKQLYVRVQPKAGIASFFRCAILFVLAWQLVEVDDATAKRLEEEQMLEVSETKPDDFVDETQAGDSAALTQGSGSGADTSGAASAKVKPDNETEVALAIAAAIVVLDKADSNLWTAGGKPKTEAIAAITGWPVTAAERDAVIVSTGA